MLGYIASVNQRSLGESYLKFDVNETTFKPTSDRIVSKVETLDGEVVVTDWGFAEGRKTISMTVDVSFDEYDLLVDFQEDNNNTYLFHYRTDSFAVIIRSVGKSSFFGNIVRATVQMDVVRKLNGDGVYLPV